MPRSCSRDDQTSPTALRTSSRGDNAEPPTPARKRPNENWGVQGPGTVGYHPTPSIFDILPQVRRRCISPAHAPIYMVGCDSKQPRVKDRRWQVIRRARQNRSSALDKDRQRKHRCIFSKLSLDRPPAPIICPETLERRSIYLGSIVRPRTQHQEWIMRMTRRILLFQSPYRKNTSAYGGQNSRERALLSDLQRCLGIRHKNWVVEYMPADVRHYRPIRTDAHVTRRVQRSPLTVRVPTRVKLRRTRVLIQGPEDEF